MPRNFSWIPVIALLVVPLTSQAQPATGTGEGTSGSTALPATPAASAEATGVGPSAAPSATVPEAQAAQGGQVTGQPAWPPPQGSYPPCPAPQGQLPGDPNLYCQQTCPVTMGFSCMGPACLGPEQWIALGKAARAREQGRWRNRWHIGPLVGVSVLNLDNHITAVGGVGGVHFTRGLGQYLGISLQGALGMGEVIYSPTQGSTQGATEVSMLSLGATLVIGPFWGFYVGPTVGWTNLWYAKNVVVLDSQTNSTRTCTGSSCTYTTKTVSTELVLDDSKFVHAGLEMGVLWGRRQNLRFSARIYGAPGNSDKLEGPAALVAFNYGFLP